MWATGPLLKRQGCTSGMKREKTEEEEMDEARLRSRPTPLPAQRVGFGALHRMRPRMREIACIDVWLSGKDERGAFQGYILG